VIEPLRADEALVADVEAARGEPGLHLWWLGQSGFLVQWDGRHLLLDPYLSDSLTRKYADTDTPHVRMTRRVIAPEALPPVDVVTSTHNHTDHLDAETLAPVLDGGAALVCPAANVAFAEERLGRRPAAGLDFGERVSIAGFELEAVPAAHPEPGPAYAGYVVRAGGRTLYHSGDTMAFEGQAERVRGADVALLPINGALGNMDARDAARLAHDIGAGVAIPCHYEMFAFNTADPADFARECERLGQPCRVLRAGERFSLVSAPGT
jgi:L-ascorbate metabolism protein UlaG (beta-lactamase superfamily)